MIVAAIMADDIPSVVKVTEVFAGSKKSKQQTPAVLGK